MPLAINVFGTQRRMARALGVESTSTRSATGSPSCSSPSCRAASAGCATRWARSASCGPRPPRTVKRAPVPGGRPARRRRRPGRCCPASSPGPTTAASSSTSGLTHTKHPETGARNLGMYRLQQQDARTVSLHWQIHKDSTSHAADRRAARRAAAGGDRVRLPAGGDLRRVARRCRPTSTSTCSPDSCSASGSSWSTASRCRCRCRRPRRSCSRAGSSPGSRLPEGPFGDHTGFYTPVEPFPFMRVETMTMRTDADLPVDHRRPSAAGGRADRQGDRADLPAADQDDRARDRRLRPARGRRLPQLRASSRSTSASPSTRRR